MRIEKTFVRFILVGILNTIFAYSLYALLVYINLHYVLITTICTVAAVLFNFKTTGRLVFNCNDNGNFFKFIIACFVVYVLNMLYLKIAIVINFNLYLAGLVILPFNALLNYFLNKYWVFKKVDL